MMIKIVSAAIKHPQNRSREDHAHSYHNMPAGSPADRPIY